MLTPQQLKVYKFISDYLEENSYSPTLQEIAKAIGITSRGVVHRYVQQLVDKGAITLDKNKHRGIVLTETFSTIPHKQKKNLPLLGYIAAGKPIEAINHSQEMDFNSLFVGDNMYVLQVKGDSMVEEGIFHGDYIVCESVQSANNGDIVVALIDNQEATLKRFQNNKDDTITLIPANKTMVPMIYAKEKVQIQGIFMGLLRVSAR